jgi:hypothetical protein
MTATEYLDRPPSGWFVLDVMRKGARKSDWVALMIDVHPNEYRLGGFRKAREAWVRLPGRHRSRDAAWAALVEDVMTTRH